MKRHKNTCWDFISRLNVKVNKSTFNRLLVQHPEFPGYNAISDFLTELNIENVVLKVESVKDLVDYPKNQLVQPNKNNNNLGIITEVNHNIVKYSENGKEYIKPIDEFDKNWNKIVLLAETTSNSGELDYSRNKQQSLFNKLRISSIFIILFAWFAYYVSTFKANTTAFYNPVIAILLTKTVGLISSLLLLYETYFPKGNNVLNKICSIGKKVKCSSVLQSKGAKLFGLLSWAEIGFLYFSGGLLLALHSFSNMYNVCVLSVLALLSALYVIYSLYYQLVLLKQWCTLCLIVQLVFIVEVLLLLPFVGTITAEFPPQSLLEIAFYFSLPLFLWLIVRPLVAARAKLKPLQNQLLMFKRDKDVFSFKLLQQQKYSGHESIAQDILKSEEAQNHLLLVSNPYCTPCSKIYDNIQHFQRYFKQKLDISVIYAIPNNDKDLRYKAALYLLSTFQEYDLQKASEISTLWYKMTKKNIDNLEREYPVKNKETAKLLLDKHIEWCLNNKVNYTPMLIFNGHLLPTEYETKDLIYFIN